MPQIGAIWRQRWLASAFAGLAGLLCCVAFELGAEEPLVIINRLRATLGAPEEEAPPKPMVIEFVPVSPSRPSASLLFEPIATEKTPSSKVIEFESRPPEYRPMELPSIIEWPSILEKSDAVVLEVPQFLRAIGIGHQTIDFSPIRQTKADSAKTKALTLAPELYYPLSLENAVALLPPVKHQGTAALVDSDTPGKWSGKTTPWELPAKLAPKHVPAATSIGRQFPLEVCLPVGSEPKVRFGVPVPSARSN